MIVATGARARDLPFAKADGKRVWTYRDAMTRPTAEVELLVIGSGAIGIEFASFYRGLGAKVTVVECSTAIAAGGGRGGQRLPREAVDEAGHEDPASAPASRSSRRRRQASPRASRPGRQVPRIASAASIVAVGIVGNIENIGLERLA